MKSTMSIFMASIGFVALCCVGYFVFYLHGGFGPAYGRVFSLKDFNVEAKSVLAKSLRFSSSNEIQFKNASVIGGKDWRLLVCFETSVANLESLVKSLSFPTRAGGMEDVSLEEPALAWWKIQRNPENTILLAKDGCTGLIIVKEDARRRVFMYTDGGPSRFPPEMWTLFENQQ